MGHIFNSYVYNIYIIIYMLNYQRESVVGQIAGHMAQIVFMVDEIWGWTCYLGAPKIAQLFHGCFDMGSNKNNLPK